MGGKKKGKKGKGHGGASKGGPVEGPVDGGRDDLRTEFLKESVLVDVVFCDNELHFESPKLKAELIPTSFLDDIKEVCCALWKDSLPGLACGDLDTKAVPNIPSLGSTTFFDWNGAVLVRLKKEKLSMGMVAQMKSSFGGRLIVETELEKMKDEMRAMKDQFKDFLVQTKARHVEAEARHVEAKAILMEAEARHMEVEAKHEARHMEAKKRHIELEKRYDTMELFLRKQVLLTNQVKRRVALEKARAKVISLLNKLPHVVFTVKDSEMVFDGEEDLMKVKNAKNLLCWGSIIPNKDIHGLTFEDVFESIYAQEVASFQEAWVWVLKFGFSKSNQEIDDAFTNLGKLDG